MNVVIWNEVGIRDTPSDKGKYVTSIYLGERFDLVGDTASEVVGSKRNHYHKITLSDGTGGWVRDELVALHVSPAAVMYNAVVCKRPDQASVTDKTFIGGDFVVVRKVSGAFLEVTGKIAAKMVYNRLHSKRKCVVQTARSGVHCIKSARQRQRHEAKREGCFARATPGSECFRAIYPLG